jgi:hypothetical protein
VPHSSSDKSFNNTKSWVDGALKYNGSTHGRIFESAFRVSNHLCRFYRDSFIAGMEKQGMPIAQPKSTVQYAVMMSTLNITGKKERVLGKYMRQYLDTTIEISVLVTCDLAFQAMILGREAMSGQHCMMCQLSRQTLTRCQS